MQWSPCNIKLANSQNEFSAFILLPLTQRFSKANVDEAEECVCVCVCVVTLLQTFLVTVQWTLHQTFWPRCVLVQLLAGACSSEVRVCPIPMVAACRSPSVSHAALAKKTGAHNNLQQQERKSVCVCRSPPVIGIKYGAAAKHRKAQHS